MLPASATVTSDGHILIAGSIGSEGVVLDSGDAGGTFQIVEHAPYPLAGVASSGQMAVAVGGSMGCETAAPVPNQGQELLRSSNSGLTWTLAFDSSSATYPFTSVSLSSSGAAIIGGGLSTQCGATELPICSPWLLIQTPGESRPTPAASPVQLMAAAFAAGPTGTVLAVTGQGLLLSSQNSGKNWELQAQVTPPPLTAVQFFAGHPGQGVAEMHVGASMLSLETTDGALTWQPGPILPRGPLEAVSWGSTRVGYAASSAHPKSLLKTTDGGRHWQALHWPGDGRQVSDLTFQSPNLGWATINTGYRHLEVLTTADGGRSWRQLPTDGLSPSDSQSGFAALGQNEQTILVSLREWGWQLYVDGPKATPEVVNGPLQPSATAVQPDGEIWSSGIKGWWYRPMARLWVGAPGSRPSEIKNLPFNAAPTEIGFTSHLRGWMVIANNLFVTKDGGQSWRQMRLRLSATEGVIVM